jgi:hypothetical protein
MARLGKNERKQWNLLQEAAQHMALEHGVRKAQDFLNSVAAIYGKPAPKVNKPNGVDIVKDYNQTNRDHDTVVHHVARSYSSLVGWKSVYTTKKTGERLNYKDKRNLEFLTEKPPVIADNLKKIRKYKRFTPEPENKAPEYGPRDTAAYLNQPAKSDSPQIGLESRTVGNSANQVGDTGKTRMATGQPPKADPKAIVIREGRTKVTGYIPSPRKNGKPVKVQLGGKPAVSLAVRDLEALGYQVTVIPRRKPKANKAD